jgi:hypothetical protein
MALALASRLHDLAVDTANVPALARHPTYLQCLIGMLGNADANVVRVSMATLFLMSKSEEVRSLIANHPGLMTAIQQKLLSSNFETKRYALATYGTLQKYVSQSAAAAPTTEATTTDERPIADLTFEREALLVEEQAEAAEAGSDKTESNTYTIVIGESLDEDDRQILEDAVLQLKGVISLFLDIYSRRCVVRSHTRAEPILAAICACGVSARLLSTTTGTTTTATESGEKDGAASSVSGDAQSSDPASDAASGKSWFGWGTPTSQAVVKSGDENASQPTSSWIGRIARSLWG